MPMPLGPRSFAATIALSVLTGLPTPRARAQPASPEPTGTPAPEAAPAPPPAPQAPAPEAPVAPSASPEAAGTPTPGRAATLPTTAAGTLDRAAAAYEFGDIQQMVDLARLVAEGAFPASDGERAEGHRLLGLGLYLSGRTDRAEAAFVQLLKLEPHARLDRATTRPDAVAFFEDVRRKHKPKKVLAYNLLPPFGQFQNGTPMRGWILLGAGVASFGVALGTVFELNRLELPGPGNLYRDDALAKRLQTINYVAVGALAATYVIGVVDGLIGFAHDDTEPRLSFGVGPTGGQVTLRF